MKNISNTWLIRGFLSLFLINAFLGSSTLPDSLFTTKEIGMWFAVSLGSLIAFFLMMNKRKSQMEFNAVDLITMLYLLGIPIVYAIFGDQATNNQELVNQIALGMTFISFRIIASSISPRLIIYCLIEILILALGWQLLIALAQHFEIIPANTTFGVTGFFFNPGPFAIYTAILTIFIWNVMLYELFKRKYIIVSILLLMIFTSMYFISASMSRSAWIGLAIGMFASTSILLTQIMKWPNRTVYFSSSVLFVIVAVVFYRDIYLLKMSSADGRMLIWQSSALMLKENWLFGVGIGNFGASYIDYQIVSLTNISDTADFINLAGDVRSPFNDLLEIFCERGIFGIIIFLSVLFYSIRGLYRLSKKNVKSLALYSVMAFGGITTLIVAGFTSYPLNMLPIGIVFWVLIAVTNSFAIKFKAVGFINIYKYRRWMAASLIFSSILFLWYPIKMIDTYIHWIAFNQNNYKNNERINSLFTLYPYLKNNPEYLNNLANCLIISQQYPDAIILLERAVKISPFKEFYFSLGYCYEQIHKYDKAIIQYSKIKAGIPSLIEPRYLIAKLYYNKGDYAVFKKLARELLNFKPKINSEEVIAMKEKIKDLYVSLD